MFKLVFKLIKLLLLPKSLKIFSYNALLQACTAPLPTYNEAIKEPVFAPPAYSAIITHSSAAHVSSLNGTNHVSSSVLSSVGDERIRESISSSNSGSKQDLLVQVQHVIETVASVEVHHANETDNEVVQLKNINRIITAF
ncbi:hypothetical protein WUBG_10996 [Wuchereria bancrofti]|uniref:Uncharacterized protein n=1 Tax=Wuchereria bancrofti TaxID=6293 RepID=J9AUF8_WUCBA|nr:hypothetical protein WUBG_10996 [Wuchereria bancrofti]